MMRGIALLEAFIREEIGRNYHTVDPMPNTWEDFQNYEIECLPTETGEYTLKISFLDEDRNKKIDLIQNATFQNETEAKHHARMIVDKHRVSYMNKP